MRVLLIASRTSFHNRATPIFPLGLAYLGTYLERRGGVQVTLIDLNTATDPHAALRQALEGGPFPFIGVGWRNYTYYGLSRVDAFLQTVREVKILSPESKIICGGPAFSLFAKQMFALSPHIDFGVVGDGEKPLAAIVNGDYRQTPGVVFRDGPDGAVIENPGLNPVDLDDLPLPRRDWPTLNLSAYELLNMQTSRGCDRKCGFCVRPRINQSTITPYPRERIQAEIEMLEAVGATGVFIVDPYVNRNKQQIIELAGLFRKATIPWWTGQFKPNVFDEEIAAAFVASRIKYPIFGIESGSRSYLPKVNGGFSYEDFQRTVRLCPAGLKPIFTFMIGMPNETMADTVATLMTLGGLALRGKRVVMEPYIDYPYSPFSNAERRDPATWDPQHVSVRSRFGRVFYAGLKLFTKIMSENVLSPFISANKKAVAPNMEFVLPSQPKQSESTTSTWE